MYKDDGAEDLCRLAQHQRGEGEAHPRRFFPGDAIDPDKIIGLDTIVKDAVELKFTATQLTKEQLAELIQIPPR